MQRLTIMRTFGQPEDLLAAKREHIDPVVKAKAGEYGHILHVAALAPDGMIVVNVWESEEGAEQAAEDPDIQRARDAMRESGAPTGRPELSGYEVVDCWQTRTT